MVFLGGTHQVLHLAPVAAHLSKIQNRLPVICLAAGLETIRLLEQVRKDMSAPNMAIEEIAYSPWLHKIMVMAKHGSVSKIEFLSLAACRLRKAAAIVSPERTSAWLRKLRLVQAPMIHVRHGAGDRAPSSEKRLKHFDTIIVPGEKDVERAIEEHNIPPEKLQTAGYVKLDYLMHHRGESKPVFNNDRPTIIYNPHFDRSLSSWCDAAIVVEHICQDRRFNIIVAPHIRLSKTMGKTEQEWWNSRNEPGRVVVDLETDKLIDMSYIRQADVYLGDMSSQLYEFLYTPRPAAFMNSHDVRWENNARYAGWHLGEVCDDPAQIVPTIEKAIACHRQVKDSQIAATRYAFGQVEGAVESTAQAILASIDGKNCLIDDL